MPRRKLLATPKPDVMPVPTDKQAQQHKAAMAFALPPHRPRWEYHTIRSEDGHTWGESFSDLGALGWELVTISKTGDAMHAPIYYAVFKRQKE